MRCQKPSRDQSCEDYKHLQPSTMNMSTHSNQDYEKMWKKDKAKGKIIQFKSHRYMLKTIKTNDLEGSNK